MEDQVINKIKSYFTIDKVFGEKNTYDYGLIKYNKKTKTSPKEDAEELAELGFIYAVAVGVDNSLYIIDDINGKWKWKKMTKQDIPRVRLFDEGDLVSHKKEEFYLCLLHILFP